MMAEPRLASHIRIKAMQRLTEAAGGFATLLAKGDPVAGSILVIARERGANPQALERFPALDGGHEWVTIESQASENINHFDEWVTRRRKNDPDLWIIELDIASAEHLTAILT